MAVGRGSKLVRSEEVRFCYAALFTVSFAGFDDALDARPFSLPAASARDQDDVFDGGDVSETVVRPYASDHAPISNTKAR